MTEKARRGFKAMDPEAQRNIASKGCTTAHKYGVAHRYSSEEAGRAGRVGGLALRFDPTVVLTWSVLLLVLALLSAVASLRRVLRIDPIAATTGGDGR